MTIRLVAFDLDGVLVDSAPGIRHSLAVAMAHVGLADATDDEAMRVMGPPLHRGIEDLLRARGEPLDLVDAVVAAYRADYVTTSLERTLLYDGAIKMIMAERAAGARVALATSKPGPATIPLLERFEIAPLLDTIGCPVDVIADTKLDVLRRVIEETRLKPAEVVMVGDRWHDVVAARDLGAWAIGVRWGYGTDDELVDAHALADRPSDLRGIIGNWSTA